MIWTLEECGQENYRPISVRTRLGSRWSGFQLNTLNSTMKSLRLVSTRPYLDGSRNSRYSHRMKCLVALADTGEDIFPVALHIGSVSVQIGIKARLCQDCFTGGNVPGKRDAYADGNDLDICYHFHDYNISKSPFQTRSEASFRWHISRTVPGSPPFASASQY